MASKSAPTGLRQVGFFSQKMTDTNDKELVYFLFLPLSIFDVATVLG